MAAAAGMVRFTDRAMGTEIAVVLAPTDAGAAKEVFALFTQWEAAMSRFRPESELMRMNRGSGRPVRVSELLFGVLAMALRAAEATDGLYDPTVFGAIRAVGYDRPFEQIDGDRGGEAPALRPFHGGWKGVRLIAAHRTVFLPPGVGIDLGGIAKGLAVDGAIDALRSLGVGAALVEAGGDLRVLGLPPGQDAWTIAVPTAGATYGVRLERGALATSGIAKRRWRKAGRDVHHLIDPRTGAPADSSVWAVSVGAGTCGEAEIAAKTAFFLGDEERQAWLRARHLSALVQRPDGGVEPIGNWPGSMEVVA